MTALLKFLLVIFLIYQVLKFTAKFLLLRFVKNHPLFKEMNFQENAYNRSQNTANQQTYQTNSGEMKVRIPNKSQNQGGVAKRNSQETDTEYIEYEEI